MGRGYDQNCRGPRDRAMTRRQAAAGALLPFDRDRDRGRRGASLARVLAPWRAWRLDAGLVAGSPAIGARRREIRAPGAPRSPNVRRAPAPRLPPITRRRAASPFAWRLNGD